MVPKVKVMVQKPNHPAEWWGDRAQTVELTGKRWKALILAGDALLYGGVGLGVAAVVLGDRWAEWGVVAIVVAMLAVPVGALLAAVGRIGRWWCHS